MKLRFIVDVEARRQDPSESKASREVIEGILSARLVTAGEGVGSGVINPPGAGAYNVEYWGVTPAGKGKS